MTATTLDTSLDRIRLAWGPLTTEMAGACRGHLQDLLAAPVTEPWLAALNAEAPASRELYRDPAHGFVLLAHTEHAGLYRPPHDHGRGWVIYAIQQGEVEMGSYARIEGPDGSIKLVKRESTLMRAGDAKIYLPGDIHDTRCVSASALLFRFTERDLKKEDREHRLTRYVDGGGAWTVPAWDALSSARPLEAQVLDAAR